MASGEMPSGPHDRVLDPQAVYEESGEDGLREALEDLDRRALEEVVRTHPVHHTAPTSMQTMSDEELRGYIVDSARRATE